MKLLTSKAGVTVLEGVIALGLLAVVTAGAFGVLLSAARKSTQPDMREEMALAVDQAKDKLQVFINTNYDSNAKNYLPSGFENGLCGKGSPVITDTTPLGAGTHNIKCLLPKICDASAASNSQFSYIVNPQEYEGQNVLGKLGGYKEGGENSKICSNCSVTPGVDYPSTVPIKFTIKCNGYEL